MITFRLLAMCVAFFVTLNSNAQLAQGIAKQAAKSAIQNSVKKEVKEAVKQQIKIATKNSIKKELKDVAKKEAAAIVKAEVRATSKNGAKELAEKASETAIKNGTRREVKAVLKKTASQSIKTAEKNVAKGALTKKTASTLTHAPVDKVATQNKKVTFKDFAEQRATNQKAMLETASSEIKWGTKGLTKSLPKTSIQAELNEILSKGPITLSHKEITCLLNDPKGQIRSYIRIKTGDSKKFQEFFIRLAKSDKKQVKELLENKEIHTYISKAIRQNGEGNVHEWLMTKNFEDFLTNPKWGDDGSFLALSLTKLVQKTENVVFKNGGQHVTKGIANSSASIQFHNGLSKVINNSSTKEEMFYNIKKYAKNNLTEVSFGEFSKIYHDVFEVLGK